VNARRTLAAWLLLAAIGLSWGVAGATTLDERLEQADALRSADPAHFQALLAALNAEVASKTPRQRALLAYLNAYGEGYAGRYEQAIRDATPLLADSVAVDVRYRAGGLVANSHAINRQFTEALRALEDMLELVDAIDSADLRAQGLGVAAITYNQLGQYRLGLHYAERTLADAGTARTRCFAGHLKMEAMFHLQALGADSTPVLAVINECRTINEKVVENLVRNMLARKWAGEGRRGEALALVRRHLPEVLATRYPRVIGDSYSFLAEHERLAGDMQAAAGHAAEAIRWSVGSPYALPLVVAHRTLYEIAEARGDMAAALAHHRSYAEADRAYLNDIKTREMAYQIVRQETLQKTQEIELLNQRNEVLQLEQRVSRQSTQNTRLVVVLLAILLATIGYWAYKIKRVQLSLRRMAQTDVLTETSNRHHFTQLCNRTLAQAERDGETAALIMFDLDHFKQINDRFGHVTGDWVLRQVGSVCQRYCRSMDHLGRLGGEEFAFLIAGCDMRDAMRLANDCRVALSSVDTSGSGYAFAVTASFGVTTTAVSGHDLARLLSHADQALYQSKREGRNRVSAFEGDAQGELGVGMPAMDESPRPPAAPSAAPSAAALIP
jgi:diguanylate cyclase